MKIYLENVEKTIGLGQLIGRLLKPGDVLCLDGDLGAGKTHLSKGIALGMEIEEDITSPTFIIVQEYEGRIPLYHFDVYRIANSEEMYYIGFDEYLKKNGAIIIEWSKLIEDILPEERLDIEILYTIKNGRDFVLRPHGNRYQELVSQIERDFK